MGIAAPIVDDRQDARQLMPVVIEEASQELFVGGEAASGAEAIARRLDSVRKLDFTRIPATMRAVAGAS